MPKIKTIKVDGNKVNLELKNVPLAEVRTTDEKGVVEAYVSVYGNVDSYGEVVDYGAFTEFFKESFPRYPKAVWHHQWDNPIGKILEWEEIPAGDARLPESIKHLGGLYIKYKLSLGVQKARETYELLKDGVITDHSFGYYVKEDYYDEESNLRHLKKIDTYEISPVLVGANAKTELVGVKSEEEDVDPDTETDEVEDTPDETTEEAGVEETPETPEEAQEETTEETPEEADEPEADESDIEKVWNAISDITKELQDYRKEIKEVIHIAKEIEAIKAIDNRGDVSAEVNPDGDQRETRATIKLIQADARRADKAIGRLLVRAKKISN